MERIFVLVRVRPSNKQDDAKGIPWKISGNSISLVNQPYKFEFDRVLGHEAKNLDVYEARTKAIVAAAVGGFNGTVFAYGQTSSGKTHTMRGSQEEPGVIPHAVQDIFKYIQQAEDREFLLRMSYMEIYNEEINDLLVPEHRKLQIHESIERGIFVAGLREEIVASSEQVLQLMEFGESHRHFGETNMNVHSSRSHTIFRMVIESRVRAEDTSANNCDAVRVSVLNLVDLAGSERVAKTGAKGERLKEGSHINKSLMTLGTVINKLSEGAETNRGHVPYRDSKLTRILQPALGGNAKTAIICNVTPSMIHVDETKGTLQFASRALRVTNCAQVNEVMTDAALLKRQKKEIEELRAKFQASHSEHLEEEILNLRNTLLQSELEKERIALELQEEKRAQAERERQYALKIENLSTMVLYSAVDEREKHTKKFNRRETWCPTLPSRQSVEKEFKISSRASGHEGIMTRREMALPPPFHELCEINDLEVSDTLAESRNSSQGSDETHLVSVFNSSKGKTFTDSIYYDNASSVEGSVAVESMTLNELREELQKVQLKYKELECEHEKQKNLKNSEIESLKKRLNLAEDAIDKDLNHNHNNVSPGRSIDGVEERFCRCVSEGIIQDKQLEEQEKYRSLEKALADVQEKLEATEAELLATSKSRDSVSSQLEAASQRLIETSIELQTFKQNCDELEKYRSLEKVLADVHEKLEATEAKLLATSKSRDSLSSQLEATSKSLTEISFELHTLKHNYAELSQKFDYSESVCKQLEISLGCTLQEKEEMTVKFSEAVLELEEEKAKLIAREREEKDRWESDLNVTKANLFSVNSELEEVKKVLEFEQEQRKSSSLGLASLIERMECSKAEYQTTINALNADIQNIRSTCEFLTQERDKVSLELLACKKDLEKRTAEGNERHRTIKQLKSTLKARNAEKSTLLSRQNSLREELDKMNYELGCARKIEEDLEGKVKLLEEQVNQEKLHFIRETSKLQVRLSVTRAKLEGSRQRQQETWDEKKLMHRKFEEAARKLKEQYVASQLECFELKKKLYDHGIS